MLSDNAQDVFDGKAEGAVVCGDCLEVMKDWRDGCVDSIVTDPPYGLEFMGKEWDHGVPGVPFWMEALRVAKPGAFLLAFGGTRTFHRLTCAIEDAGWEIRDCIMWVYGSGFPKSLDISKAIDKAAGAEREVVGSKLGQPGYSLAPDKGRGTYSPNGRSSEVECAVTAPVTEPAKQWDGWGTALKPSYEPVIVAMKPCDGTFANNALKHGVAGLNIGGCRIGMMSATEVARSGMSTGTPGYEGGHKPISWAGGREPQGRWPANLIHDGSEEVVGLFPARVGGAYPATQTRHDASSYSVAQGNIQPARKMGDSGTAARFFYCTKASRRERTCGGKVDNRHPTVKPLALMEYLCGLTMTPTGGIVLDLFAGSGTTGMACRKLGRRFILIETDADHSQTARQRIAATPRPLPGLEAHA